MSNDLHLQDKTKPNLKRRQQLQGIISQCEELASAELYFQEEDDEDGEYANLVATVCLRSGDPVEKIYCTLVDIAKREGLEIFDDYSGELIDLQNPGSSPPGYEATNSETSTNRRQIATHIIGFSTMVLAVLGFWIWQAQSMLKHDPVLFYAGVVLLVGGLSLWEYIDWRRGNRF